MSLYFRWANVQYLKIIFRGLPFIPLIYRCAAWLTLAKPHFCKHHLCRDCARVTDCHPGTVTDCGYNRLFYFLSRVGCLYAGKLVYKDSHRDHRCDPYMWSLYTGSITWKVYLMAAVKCGHFISRWSLYTKTVVFRTSLTVLPTRRDCFCFMRQVENVQHLLFILFITLHRRTFRQGWVCPISQWQYPV